MNTTPADTNTVEPAIAPLDQLPADHLAVITKIATDLGVDAAEVLGWAVDLLARYVRAGGEP